MTELLTNLLDQYIMPILKFSDVFINQKGQLQPIGSVDNIFKFENKRYTPDGLNGPQYIVPTIPFKDQEYLTIKNDKGSEVFNPFTNIKHMTMVALIVKEKLVEYFCENTDEDEVSNDSISFFNVNEPDGQVSVIFANGEDPIEMEEIVKVTGTDMIFDIWCLCVEAMKKCVNKMPKQFDNKEKAWKYITNMVNEWDKSRRKIATNIKEDKEHELFFNGTEDELISDYSDNDFVEEDNINDYLFNRFSKQLNECADIEDKDLTGNNFDSDNPFGNMEDFGVTLMH